MKALTFPMRVMTEKTLMIFGSRQWQQLTEYSERGFTHI